jgi:hypothetical protein
MVENLFNPTMNPNYLPSPYGDPNMMIQLSQELINLTEQYIATINSVTANLTPPVINPIFPTLSTAPVPATAPPPTLINVGWNVPTQPGAFGVAPPNVANLLPGPFGGVPPQLSFPPRPNPFDTLVPATPPINTNFQYPTLSVALPQPPALYTLDVVDFTISEIPTFDAAVPALTIAAPNPIPYQEPGMYTSQLLTDMQTSLSNAINSGGNIMLPQNIETGIWERARDKEYRGMADALAELDRMETMGWAFPPGVWLDARIKLQTEMGYTVATFNRDAATAQAKLALDNLNTARGQAVDLEKAFISYANDIANRQLEAAKYVTQASIAIYNAQVEAYKASLEGYKTQAMIYETQIKGILAQVEIVKAHIEYEQVKSQINTALVEQYKAMVQAAELTVEIYKAQLEAIKIQAEVEKLKVDIFGAQIQAYVAQVNAYTAQVEAYKAEIEAQGVIEDTYKVSVEAYTATVQAGAAEANALIEGFKAQIAAYTAQLDGYKASLEAMTEQARAAALYNESQASVYNSLTQALSAYNDVLTKQWQAVINEQLQVTQIGVTAAKANGDLYIATEGLVIEAAKTGAQVVAQLGAAALGAIHWANQSQWSVGQQVNMSALTETITSDSTNVNINE